MEDDFSRSGQCAYYGEAVEVTEGQGDASGLCECGVEVECFCDVSFLDDKSCRAFRDDGYGEEEEQGNDREEEEEGGRVRLMRSSS